MRNQKEKLYLAAPLFNGAEREFNSQLRHRLRQYFDVFLPQEDGLLIFDLLQQGIALLDAKRIIFEADSKAIRACDVLLIVMNGRTVDEGAAFELGMAYTLGKRCVALKTDARQLLSFGDNPMLECAVSGIFNSIEALLEHFASRALRG